jgi:hypothetical protein
MTKTTTLTDNFDSPTVTILEGHHDVETFNKAFEAEGWEASPWPESYISHEYWERGSDGSWTCSNKTNPKAIPVTVADWAGPKENQEDLSSSRVLH